MNIELDTRLDEVQEEITRVVKLSREAIDIVKRLKVAIIGPANSGKSSLMNRICGEGVSIVSNIEGTTRDTIEVYNPA